MANPSDKSKPITDFLETLYGRITAITHDRCIPPPIGCGRAGHRLPRPYLRQGVHDLRTVPNVPGQGLRK